jgi:heat shock protein HslJ
MWKLALLAVLALVSAACLGSDFEDSIEGSWQLTSGTVDGTEIPLLDTHPITINFQGDMVNGTASCNSYGGGYELSGSSITFQPLAMTEMACSPPETMEAEMMYGQALSQVTTVLLNDGLILRGPGIELVFEALEPVSDADLTNTVWVLDGLVSGDAVSSVLGERATLEFFTDGSALGGTGCRTFAGQYTINGAEVLMTELAADGHECPPDLADQDAHVLAVLGDGFRAEVAGNTLTLSSQGDEGLVYIADA